jgi:hypothetical protein
MSESIQKYDRLTRSRYSLNGLGSLWLGKDHVLLVRNAFAVERYRRWYLRDIQALVIRRTSSRMVWNAILGVFALMLLSAAGASFYGSMTMTSTGMEDIGVLFAMTAIFGVIGFGFVAIALMNTLMGPSCTVFIQTPHGLERLSTPSRVAGVEKLTARLQPLLLAAQAMAGDQENTLREIAAALDQPVS